jgi:DNA polymerase theta
MLEVVAAGAVCSPHDVLRYINCTLLAATYDFKDVVAISTRKALEWLSKEEFIR